MRKPKPRKRPSTPPLSEYEKQIKRDEGLRTIWFKSVHTMDETLELIRFYCRRVGSLPLTENTYTQDVNEIIRTSDRIKFLAKGLK